jgi:AraC family transcriptional regulator
MVAPSDTASASLRGVLQFWEEAEMETSSASAPGKFPHAGIGDLAGSLIRLLQTATHEVERDRTAAKAFIAQATSLLQVEVDRRSAGLQREPAAGGLAGWQMRRVIAFVEQQLGTTIRVEDLSAIAQLSVVYFAKTFKRTFGETPHAYVTRRRLARARHLMLTSDMQLSEVALACGLADQAHLCKLFRKFIGLSPATWRRERRASPSRSTLFLAS